MMAEETESESLIKAVRNNDLQLAAALLELVDPNIKNEDNNTALMIACNRGYDRMVSLLITKRANVNLTDDYGQTALMFAAAKDNIEIVQMLLDAGAKPELKSGNGNTALDVAKTYAKTEKQYQIVRLLQNVGKKTLQERLGKYEGETSEEFICPISGELMDSPLLLKSSGKTYDRKSIQRYARNFPDTAVLPDPQTRTPVPKHELNAVGDLQLQKRIENFVRDKENRACMYSIQRFFKDVAKKLGISEHTERRRTINTPRRG